MSTLSQGGVNISSELTVWFRRTKFILAKGGEVLGVCVGRDCDPEDEGDGAWEQACAEMQALAEEVAEDLADLKTGDGRGDFNRITHGFSYGGGQGVSLVLARLGRGADWVVQQAQTLRQKSARAAKALKIVGAASCTQRIVRRITCESMVSPRIAEHR